MRDSGQTGVRTAEQPPNNWSRGFDSEERSRPEVPAEIEADQIQVSRHPKVVPTDLVRTHG